MPTDDSAFDSELQTLLDNGRLIAAIKLYRERTGAGLAEAKAAVEAFAKGASLQPLRPAASATPIAPDLEDEVVSLLRQNQKIAAIRLYRQRTGAGLKQSKDAIETIAAAEGLMLPQSGCIGGLGIWFALFALLVMLTALAFLMRLKG